MSADTPRNADAVPPPRADHEQAAVPDRAQPAERAPGQQPADAGRSSHPAQALNRAEHNAARHERPPIQRQADASNPAPADASPTAAGSNPGPRETPALNRAEYNANRHMEPPIRGSDTAAGQSRDQASGPPAITHYHADFKGQRTDLYTDGTRWVSGDLHQREAASAGRDELPDDSPTGEDLVESAGERSSRLEKMRREIFEDDDVTDVISDNTNAWHDMFTPPQISSHEAAPLPGPHFSATQHTGMDVGTGATALFALGLAIDRVAIWGKRHLEKHPEGD